METRAHDAVELAQTLDDHGVLLLDHEEHVARDRTHDQEDQKETEQAAKEVEEEEHDRSLERDFRWEHDTRSPFTPSPHTVHFPQTVARLRLLARAVY